MNDTKYFDNIHKIEDIIKEFDSEKLPAIEANKLYETGKELINECETILNNYSGIVEEMSFTDSSN